MFYVIFTTFLILLQIISLKNKSRKRTNYTNFFILSQKTFLVKIMFFLFSFLQTGVSFVKVRSYSASSKKKAIYICLYNKSIFYPHFISIFRYLLSSPLCVLLYQAVFRCNVPDILLTFLFSKLEH